MEFPKFSSWCAAFQVNHFSPSFRTLPSAVTFTHPSSPSSTRTLIILHSSPYSLHHLCPPIFSHPPLLTHHHLSYYLFHLFHPPPPFPLSHPCILFSPLPLSFILLSLFLSNSLTHHPLSHLLLLLPPPSTSIISLSHPCPLPCPDLFLHFRPPHPSLSSLASGVLCPG